MTRSLRLCPLDFSVEAEVAFKVIAADALYAFWLDSARAESSMSRFSYVGVVPDESAVVRVGHASKNNNPWRQFAEVLAQAPTVDFEGHDSSLCSYLKDELLGGYVGYFGYESRRSLGFATSHRAETPDALWMPAVRYLMIDHLMQRAYLVGDDAWLEETVPLLQEVGSVSKPLDSELPYGLDFKTPERADYVAAIENSLHEIFEGNSYEVCLTAETRASLPPEINNPQGIFNLYRAQRRHNPAPYAAFLRCKDHWVLSSSPERYLSISAGGYAEAKPIKGTVERSADPLEDLRNATWLHDDPKTRAENLMIVDLMRNDLSQVSQPGSVKVPVLMGVESYATVHQLVSTIAAQLRSDVSAVDAAAACFPGGSMTGAPKPSTMAIIDRLENRARGIYSGALGFFSASGAAQLSIVIRTLVVLPDGEVSLSAGGAIVADSNPDAEYEEMLAKLRAAVPGESIF
ncbi:MAG: anthranilate synthase component I family protein [Rothia sp. (in: high G+C Gram-positive bacteria)]|nr:anthranilate synthase component I family protein [Rothia sp. (in: high G+C Gram-positive bacteria)]